MSLNMNKEIRLEIKILRVARRRVCQDWTAEIKTLGKEKSRVEAALTRAKWSSGRAVNKIDRRLAILRGRLS